MPAGLGRGSTINGKATIGCFKALRLRVSLLAAGLTLAGFKVTYGNVSDAWLPALATLLISCATMAWNDFRDRHHDTKKGKTLACDHPAQFLAFTLVLWILCFAAAGLLWTRHASFAWLAGFMIAAGFLYSEVRLIPLAPNGVVAVTAGSAVLFPVFVSHHSTTVLWILFGATFCGIYAREILKDFDDQEIDAGYKWTLPQIGPRAATRVILSLFCAATGLLLWLAASTFRSPLPFIVLLPAILLLCRNGHTPRTVKTVKLTMDIGMAILLVALLL